MGLSPRIRGNPSPLVVGQSLIGSIPAHTGKPTSPSRMNSRKWVYPRAYGETTPVLTKVNGDAGLSPRIRGNRVVDAFNFLICGSIPAHTGKPAGGLYHHHVGRVYPRAYGETKPDSIVSERARGLSPRIRGNSGSGGASRPRPGLSPRIRGNH